jgi:hypothetical protein
VSVPESRGASSALARGERRSPARKPPPPTFEDPKASTPVRREPAPPVPAPAAPRSPNLIQARSPESARPRRAAPERPSTASANGAPVVTRLPAPFTVRLSQFLWAMSLLTGAVAVVYLFVIRAEQTPLIVEFVRGVVAGRSDQTYGTAADIVFWSVFGISLGLLLIQVVLLVSFSNRKPHVRWWQLATVSGQILLFLLSSEIIAVGEHGPLLRQLLLAQWGIGLLALLFSTFRGALQWSARRVDVRRVSSGDGGEF